MGTRVRSKFALLSALCDSKTKNKKGGEKT